MLWLKVAFHGQQSPRKRQDNRQAQQRGKGAHPMGARKQREKEGGAKDQNTPSRSQLSDPAPVRPHLVQLLNPSMRELTVEVSTA